MKGKLQSYQQQQKLVGNQVFNNVHLVLWLTVNFTFEIPLGVNCLVKNAEFPLLYTVEFRMYSKF